MVYRIHLENLFSTREWRIFFLLAIVLISGLGIIGYRKFLEQTVPLPEDGGQYIEGITGNRSQFSDLITHLTFVGLVGANRSGEYFPILAKQWTISPDGKTYTFHLQDNIESSKLASILREQEMFKSIDIQTPDPSSLILRLKQPFGPFLALLTTPLFPYGPFELIQEEEDEVVFEAQDDFILGRPHLDKIVIKIFADDKALADAVKKNEITGAVTEQTFAGWQTYRATLPRKIVAIFNVEKEVVQDVDFRTQIVRGEKQTEQKTLKLVTTAQLRNYAESLRQKWATQNIVAEVRIVEDGELKQKIIPTRDYDVLVYGLDLGRESDPYRFWHSSQATPEAFNLAQLKDKNLDFLLGEARRIVDDKERQAKYDEINRKIDELAVVITLQDISFSYQIDKKIKGIEVPSMVTPAARYNMAWKWYTKERRIRKTEDGAQKTE